MLDVDNLIDYMLSIFYTGDGDATLSAFLANNRPNNWYGMKDRTNPNQGFRFFNNDCEHTLGSPNSQVDRTGPFRDAAGSNIGNFLYANPQYLHEDLMWSPEYRQRFADHAQRHFFNGGALTLQSCTNRFIAKAQQITRAIRAYSARWGDPITDGLGRAPYGEADWTNTLNTILTTWFPPRAGIVLQQLRVDQLFPSNSAPIFSQNGGAVPAGYSLVDLIHECFGRDLLHARRQRPARHRRSGGRLGPGLLGGDCDQQPDPGARPGAEWRSVERDHGVHVLPAAGLEQAGADRTDVSSARTWA